MNHQADIRPVIIEETIHQAKSHADVLPEGAHFHANTAYLNLFDQERP